MTYRYETHLHTRYGSLCGTASGCDYVQPYIDAGYTGLFVTDHFFAGNCAVDQSQPWPKQVDDYCRGYDKTREEGEKRGLQVFFAWEQNYNGDEYLIYGLDKAWLLAHPEVKAWTRPEQLAEVHRYGGCVIQAHPFRDRSYLHAITLAPTLCDGVEVYNSSNAAYNNVQALRYARHLGLPMIGGTDIHSMKAFSPSFVSGVELPTPLRSAADFATRVRAAAPMRPIAPLDELEAAPLGEILLPVIVLGDNGKPADVPVESLLA